MIARLVTIAVLFFTAGITFASVNTSSDYEIKPVPQPENKFDEVVEIFLVAVDRGELIVFNNIITREMLDPVQVKYIYSYNDEDPSISVFSLLKRPLTIPGVDDCTAGAIEVLLDIDGTIIDSSIHIPSN